MRVRLAALAAVIGSFAIALPAQAQVGVQTAANTIPAGAVDNTIPIWVWIWILVGTGVATVGFAAYGVFIIGDRKR
jgi:hypothetical protein